MSLFVRLDKAGILELRVALRLTNAHSMEEH